jgi:nicotinate-nucleotide adenylyltransferase
MRIGILGGTFDPVHEGHLQVAQLALQSLDLDRVILVPAARNPLKAQGPCASAVQRLAMLALATQGRVGLMLSDYEARQPGPSYSLHTARYFGQAYRPRALFWIVGQDQYAQLGRWHGIDELAQTVHFAVAARGQAGPDPLQGVKPDDPAALVYLPPQVLWLPASLPWSSSQIRKALAHNPRECPPGLLPTVHAYVMAHGLYGTRS